jgi:nitroreductase
MELKELVKRNRSYRRFDGNYIIERETLVELVSLARWAASGRNAQPLKFYINSDPAKNEAIFSTLEWAGYLKTWKGPVKEEQPTGYIVILLDKSISDDCYCDHGIAMENILLGAVEKGLGGCIVGSIHKKKLAEILKIPAHLEILNVVALGKPVEQVVLTDVGEDGDIKYYRDEAGVHYVPKRSLDELIVDF